MLVRHVMTGRVVTVRPDTAVREAAAVLVGHGFTALPVVDADGDLVGIVTEADLLCGRVNHDPRSARLADEVGAAAPGDVAEVMAAPVSTVAPWDDVADVVERMRADGLRAMPVVLPGGSLVGIVTRRDVLGATVRTDDAIADDVRRRLAAYAGPGRWTVEVCRGAVTLADAFGDPVEQHAACGIAAAVPGVLTVRTTVRDG